MGNNHTILGLSPGTRTFGYAIFRGGELVDFGIKSFKGKWSEKKLLHITASLSKLVEQYRPDVITIKISGAGKRAKSMLRLLNRIASLFRRKKIKVVEYTLQDIKYSCVSKLSNVKKLHLHLMEKYPTLSFVNNKGLNRHIYYGKMFEAIGAVKPYFSEL